MQAMANELQEILGKVISDLSGTANAALEIVGDRLGLYRPLAEIGPATPWELAFPNLQFTGFDYHGPSIDRARELAAEHGLCNARFEVAIAQPPLPSLSPPHQFEGRTYDFVAIFDVLHDMGDPRATARQVHRNLQHDRLRKCSSNLAKVKSTSRTWPTRLRCCRWRNLSLVHMSMSRAASFLMSRHDFRGR